jgi:glycosyltransferase involved in cell wall biosynthesis
VRIAIDARSAVEEAAGIGRFTRGLIDGLAAVDPDNTYRLLLPRGATWPSLLPPNFAIRPFPLSFRASAVLWHRLGAPLPVTRFTGEADVYHAPNFLLPPTGRSRGVVTVHDLTFFHHPECAVPGLVKLLKREVPRSLARAAAVTADSQATASDLVAAFAARPEQITVVPGAVDARFRPERRPEVLAAMDRLYGGERPFILTVGRLEPRKNLRRLIAAYAEVRERLSGAPRLLIAGGQGWLYQDLYDAVIELGLTDEVVFLGFVPDDHLPALLSLARAFVYPSLYEGFGLPVLEAMACGTPVACSNTSSLPEVAGEAALLFDPTDTAAIGAALERLLNDDALRADLARRGPEQAARFSWTDSARRLRALYERIAA